MIKIAIVFLLFVSTNSYAEVYKWVDDKGKVHFSDKSPENTKADVIEYEHKERKKVDVKIKSIGFKLSTPQKEQIIKAVEDVYTAYNRLFYIRINEIVQINIKLFKTQEKFDKYYARLSRKPLKGARGVYFSRRKELIVRQLEDWESTMRTIRHEISHAVLRTFAPRSPKWLNEGLAEYFETLNIQNETIVFEAHVENEKKLQRLWKRKELPNLNEYFKMTNRRWISLAHNNDPVAYTMAWGVTSTLMSDKAGKGVITRLLQDLKRTHEHPTLAEIDKAYIGGIDSFELKWIQWAYDDERFENQDIYGDR